jgi:hypothetical protein
VETDNWVYVVAISLNHPVFADVSVNVIDTLYRAITEFFSIRMLAGYWSNIPSIDCSTHDFSFYRVFFSHCGINILSLNGNLFIGHFLILQKRCSLGIIVNVQRSKDILFDPEA